MLFRRLVSILGSPSPFPMVFEGWFLAYLCLLDIRGLGSLLGRHMGVFIVHYVV